MNRIIKYLLCATLFLVAAMPAMAERYSWEGVSFDAPAEGYVNFCSPTRLEIIWEDVMLVVEQMMPVKESEDTFFSYLVSRARGFNMYDIEKTKIKVKGFKTYSIDGTLPDGSRAIISDLSAKKEKIRLTITVNYLLGNRDQAEDIIKSFRVGSQKIENPAPREQKEQRQQKIQSPEKAEEEELIIKKEKELEDLRQKGVLHEA